MFDAEGVGKGSPFEPALKRSRPAGSSRFEFEFESVYDVVEEVSLSNGDAAEGDIGEVDLQARDKSLNSRVDIISVSVDTMDLRRGHGSGLRDHKCAAGRQDDSRATGMNADAQ